MLASKLLSYQLVSRPTRRHRSPLSSLVLPCSFPLVSPQEALLVACERGDLRLVVQLLRSPTVNPNVRDRVRRGAWGSKLVVSCCRWHGHPANPSLWGQGVGEPLDGACKGIDH